MKDLEELKKAIRLYKFTLVVLAVVIIVMMVLFSTILLYIVPSVVSRSYAETSDSRRQALLEEIGQTVEDTLSKYDINPN